MDGTKTFARIFSTPEGDQVLVRIEDRPEDKLTAMIYETRHEGETFSTEVGFTGVLARLIAEERLISLTEEDANRQAMIMRMTRVGERPRFAVAG